MLYYAAMDMFSALAEPTRRSILEMLASNGQLSATAISSKFRVSPPAISQHLKILREARLVSMEKHAQQRLYAINPEAMNELEEWARKIAAQWDKRFDALEKLAQAEERKTEKSKLKGRKEKHNGTSG
jgi:DNA-binding transcriptional ArsR family regulator